MVRELQLAEDAGERVWLIGHVLAGWDGSNPLLNPSDRTYHTSSRISSSDTRTKTR
jgi:hypothetical protein